MPLCFFLAACGPSASQQGDYGPAGDDAASDGAAVDATPGRDAGGSDAGQPDPSCFDPALGPVLAIHSGGGADFSTDRSWVVLSGTAPADVGGSPPDRITVNGSTRRVSFDAAASRWSYHGALAQGANAFDVRAHAGALEDGPVGITVTLTVPPAPETHPGFGPGVHLLGAWMFPWFNADPSWECSSPWWPVAGFLAWDGSTAWAREQLLDAMDAGIDFIGLQYDTKDDTLPWGVRFTNVVNSIQAWRELLEDGYRPPRLAMFLDTAIVNSFHVQNTGSDLDVSGAAGRAEFFDYVDIFYTHADQIFGARYTQAALARYSGRPMLAFWHTDTGSIVGASDAFVQDLKARYQARFGVDPYLIGHPNFWAQFPSTDEISLMFGPPQHDYRGGWDGAGKETMNITPGFWNPTSNPFYLPREGGTHYDTAWGVALANRAAVDHLYVDSWNETGEGSGLFEAETFSYTSADSGSCGTWNHRHDDFWGPTTRHYIDFTATRSAQWSDLLSDDAEIVAHDLPASLAPGERRVVTVLLRNTGTRAWTQGDGDHLEVTQGGFWVPGGAGAIDDARDDIPRYGGLFRGRPRAFTFELIGPCEGGSHLFAFQMQRTGSPLYGAAVNHTLQIP